MVVGRTIANVVPAGKRVERRRYLIGRIHAHALWITCTGCKNPMNSGNVFVSFALWAAPVVSDVNRLHA